LLRSAGIYRVADAVPPRGVDEAQEVPTDEAQRLERVPRV
jgi:hypothetical protein